MNHVDAGAAATIPPGDTIVQLTDLHIGPPGTTPYGTDTAANFRWAAAAIRAMALHPIAVLLTGDLSDKGEPESYRHLRSMVTDELEVLGCPVLAVVGNHDHRGSFRQAYLGDSEADDTAPHYYSYDTDAVRIVMCDSYLAGQATGRLGTEQLAWLDNQLSGAGGRTTIVALHHPSVPRGVPRAQDYLLEDRDELAAVLLAHRVGAVLCGHSHVATAASFGGTLHAAAPATAYLLDPSVREGGRAYQGAGFSICTVREGRAVVNPYIVPVDAEVLYDHRPALSAR